MDTVVQTLCPVCRGVVYFYKARGGANLRQTEVDTTVCYVELCPDMNRALTALGPF